MREPALSSPGEMMAVAPARSAVARCDDWLESHLDWVAWAVIGVGFALRLIPAIRNWLNPDEMVNFMVSDLPTLPDVLRTSIGCQHPPLHHVILFMLRGLGRSDLVLRLPSVLCGTALLWFGYRWLGVLFDKTAALIGLLFLTFAPELLLFSHEVRAYAITLCLVFAALYCLEQALSRGSNRMMYLFSGLLVLAVLTDFPVFWLVFALGIYVLVFALRGRLTPSLRGTWLKGQAAVLAAALAVIVAIVPVLIDSDAQQYMRESALRWVYFLPGTDSLIGFVLGNSLGVFQFIMSSPALGIVALVLFAGGLLLLARPGGPRRDRALLLVLPFAISLLMALTGRSPFGATRHSLLPGVLIFAGMSFVLARVVQRRFLFILLAGAVLGPIWALSSRTAATWYIAPRDQRRELMTEAMAYVRQVTPANGIVLSEDLTQVLLVRYLGPGLAQSVRARPDGFIEYECERFRMINPEAPAFVVDSGIDKYNIDFADGFYRLKEAYGVRAGDSVCVVAAGWGENLASLLERRRGIRFPKLRTFGRNISVFVVPVGDEPGMAAQAGRLAGLQQTARELVRGLTGRPEPGLRAVLWPTWLLTEDDSASLAGAGVQPITYDRLYRELKSGTRRLEDYLPAAALWQFGNTALHVQGLRAMDEGHSYEMAVFRFDLVERSPGFPLGLYRISLQ